MYVYYVCTCLCVNGCSFVYTISLWLSVCLSLCLSTCMYVCVCVCVGVCVCVCEGVGVREYLPPLISSYPVCSREAPTDLKVPQ